MYLDYFQLKEYPFALTPNVDYFFRFYFHQEALNVLMIGINNNEGFIAVTGEVGSGKTLLCRKLLQVCDEKKFITAYIPNPQLDALGLYRTLARDLEIELPDNDKPEVILNALQEKLMEFYRNDKKVLFIIDEAQVMSYDTLEALRLLSNLETKDSKLLQIVLFAQPELTARLNTKKLRQLRQRITFSYELKPIKDHELRSYVKYRVKLASHNEAQVQFSKAAFSLLHKASMGIPRIIHVLCHKCLLLSYGLGVRKVNARIMLKAIKNTSSSSKKYILYYVWNFIILLLFVLAVAEITYFIRMHL